VGVFGFIGVIYTQELSPELWQFPPGLLYLCGPTNAVFKLVTIYILIIDVFETYNTHKKT
jgi:hypothetical protein